MIDIVERLQEKYSNYHSHIGLEAADVILGLRQNRNLANEKIECLTAEVNILHKILKDNNIEVRGFQFEPSDPDRMIKCHDDG